MTNPRRARLIIFREEEYSIPVVPPVALVDVCTQKMLAVFSKGKTIQENEIQARDYAKQEGWALSTPSATWPVALTEVTGFNDQGTPHYQAEVTMQDGTPDMAGIVVHVKDFRGNMVGSVIIENYAGAAMVHVWGAQNKEQPDDAQTVVMYNYCDEWED